MKIREARLLCPSLIVLAADPPKYRAVHLQFKNIFRDYSPAVTPLSIDEAVIDFSSVMHLSNKSLVEIAKEIKSRMRNEIGEWISCSIGISTNRFLAKLVASLQKPDGLEVISHENVETVYKRVQLLDLCGINTRYQAGLMVISVKSRSAHGMRNELEASEQPTNGRAC